ncbi:MAG TPA: OstA-like protein, partial [Bacteroidia bacterium]|nr:OstA-like protein [Bacteroidia bacterium]
FDKRLGEGAQRLIGNVELENAGVIMDCDSAYVYTDNSCRAFGHVHLSKKDSMDLYGDSIHYFSDTRQALMFGDIRYVKKSLTLTTHHLVYVADSSKVNYWDGGTVQDSATTLVSRRGTYFMKRKICAFKDTVVLTNPSYNIHCDTMSYEPDVQTAHFSGPTYITGKNTNMYCIAGYYNSHTGVSEFWNHAVIISKKGERLSGDKIYYDKKKDFGEVNNNMTLVDSTDNITIKGDYALYKGEKRTIMVTHNAVMDQVYEKDTLHLHGDTLYGYNISMSDTNKNSHNPKLLLAYHHVKFYKKDMQGKCDSLSYDEKDSVMKMFHAPVVWADQNQLTADTMKLFLENKKLTMLDMRHNSFIISRDTLASKEDSLQFNQIKGRNMKGFFKNNKINKVKVMGNAQTVYYVYSDNNTTVVGANRADCSNMLIFIDSNKIHSITFLQKPDATLYPMKDIKPADFLLGNFIWRIAERPMRKEDIFKN